MKTPFTYIEANSDSICEFEPSMEGYHRNAYQEIIWLKEGQGSVNIIIDDRQQTIPFNAFVIIGKGRVHHMACEGYLDGAIIRFADEFLSRIPYLLFNEHAEQIWIDAGTETSFFDHITQLLNIEYAKDRQFLATQSILQNLLVALLEKLEQLKKQQSPRLKGQTAIDFGLFEQFYQLLEKHYTDQHQLDFYVQALNISVRKLSNITKQVLGQTAAKVIEERLVIEAKRLLLYANLSVKEITYELGFEDPSYFSKFFSRHTAISPSQYKAHQLAIFETLVG